MNWRLRRVARAFGAHYIEIENLNWVGILFNKDIRKFCVQALNHARSLFSVQKRIDKAYKTSSTSHEVLTRMYDLEYGGIDGSHYMYLNSLLNRTDFELITGLEPLNIVNKTILDIGAGSNELLRFCHDEFNIPSNRLSGIDISPASASLVTRDGFNAYTGRVEDQALKSESYDIIFLSYFVDYDTDQKATFRRVLELIHPNGKIILEGYFPCRPFGLLKYDKDESTFVTRGRNASDDISLVCEFFQEMGRSQGREIKIERIVRSSRFIYNRNGLHRLPSFFIVFSIQGPVRV